MDADKVVREITESGGISTPPEFKVLYSADYARWETDYDGEDGSVISSGYVNDKLQDGSPVFTLHIKPATPPVADQWKQVLGSDSIFSILSREYPRETDVEPINFYLNSRVMTYVGGTVPVGWARKRGPVVVITEGPGAYLLDTEVDYDALFLAYDAARKDIYNVADIQEAAERRDGWENGSVTVAEEALGRVAEKMKRMLLAATVDDLKEIAALTSDNFE